MTTTAPTNQPPRDNNPSTKPGTIQPHPMTHKPMVMTWTALPTRPTRVLALQLDVSLLPLPRSQS